MAKNVNLPEPNWREQLYGYGFTDEDIDAINVVAPHRFLIKMNLTFQDALIKILKDQNKDFHDKMIEDVREVITQELRPIKEDISQLKTNMEIMKAENDADHVEFRKGLHKLAFTNKWYIILLRLLALGILMYFLIKHAHANWWPAGLVSFLGL